MKTKKLTPRNAAPVQRENTATVFRDGNDGNAIATLGFGLMVLYGLPFAGDDAE